MERAAPSAPVSGRRSWWSTTAIGDEILSAEERPAPVAAIMAAVAAIAIGGVLPFRPWPTHTAIELGGLAGLSAAISVSFLLVRHPPAGWLLRAAAAVGTLVVTTAQLLGRAEHVNFAALYILVGLYAAVYFTPTWLFAELTWIGAAYGGLLVLDGSSPGAAVVAWLAVVGTAVVASALVGVLVHELRARALLDPLTGLPNRRMWTLRLEDEVARAARTGRPLAVALLDLDHFKQLNDRLGHRAGDRALVDLGSAWRTAVRRGGDLMARIGGDEFAVLAPDTDAPALDTLIRRLRARAPDHLHFSAGLITWDGQESPPALLHRADLAMLATKAPDRTARTGAAP